MSLALGLLMDGDIDGALAVVEALAEESAGHPYLTSAQALVLAADARPKEAILTGALVTDNPAASYLDRQTAAAAVGLANAQLGDDEEARRALIGGVVAADATDDRVAQALARLALAVGLEALDAQDAPVAREDAARHLDALDLAATDWSTAYRLAACPSPHPHPLTRRRRGFGSHWCADLLMGDSQIGRDATGAHPSVTLRPCGPTTRFAPLLRSRPRSTACVHDGRPPTSGSTPSPSAA